MPPARAGRTVESRREWSVPIDSLASPVLGGGGGWNVGLITGPSGAGKSVIASELLQRAGGRLIGVRDADGIDRPPFEWPMDASLVDGFPRSLTVPQITGWLSSVGFSSPPDWLKPFGRLSNGQQFRASLARCLAEQVLKATVKESLTVAPIGYDEFGSLVDAPVRRVAAAACAKAVRKADVQFVAVTCHDDVAAWLEADWVMRVEAGRVNLTVYTDDPPAEIPAGVEYLARGCLQRPDLVVNVVRLERSEAKRLWPLFKPHHYLSGELAGPALCHLALARSADQPEEAETPAAFVAVLPFPHPRRPGWREHRCVCLPDWQGVGIGNAVSEHVAQLFKTRDPQRPYFSTTSHPGMIAHRKRSPRWRMIRRPGLRDTHRERGMKDAGNLAGNSAVARMTAGFEYVGC